MKRTPSLLIVAALTFAALAIAAQAQDAKPDIEALWKKGSEWGVGDNVKPVAHAKAALIKAGEPALKHALTRLGTTDGLEIRCLDDVLLGLKAFEPLIEHLGDADVNARRNVGRILGSFNVKKDDKDEAGVTKAEIDRIAGAVLARFVQEEDVSARFWLVSGPARWKVDKALPALIEMTRSPNERVRVRSVPLLRNFASSADVLTRLLELLEDARYFVRDAAIDELKQAGPAAAQRCQDKATALDKSKLTAAEVRLLRILMTVIGANNVGQPAWELAGSLGRHENPNIRGDSYALAATLALQEPKQAETSATRGICKDYLESKLATETEPYAKGCLDAALERVK